jgi:hypothetical protein
MASDTMSHQVAKNSAPGASLGEFESKSWVTVSKKTNPKFIACLIEFPHVMTCFENIVAQRAPSHGLEKFSKCTDSLNLMIEQFFLPILVEEGLVRANPMSPIAYSPCAQRIIVERNALTIPEQAYTVVQVAKSIAMDVNELDTRDSTLSINLSGPVSQSEFSEFMTKIRQSAQNLLESCQEKTNDSSMNIAFLARVTHNAIKKKDVSL